MCAERAPAIAAEVARERGVRIGRTSTRLRNPANRAPAWARERITDGALPPEPSIETLPDGGVHALFPIPAAGLCMPCHGDRGAIDSGVRGALAARYPDDRATGYAPGDLRGWFWVEAP